METLFIVLALHFCSLFARGEVVIKQGILEGRTLTTRNGRNISGFLGIPYAKPPVGPLRFKNPIPADSWNGTFKANTDGNPCPQLGMNKEPIGDEDCLYLNVYTPKVNPSVPYPVMAYVHGGLFVSGSGNSSYAGPDYIMDKDVVLVAMNYRLGVLGFLSTGDEQAPGNFGLKDQSLALRWVKENIRAFGGDPNRVTLFGQSAGSVSVNLHVLSDLSDDLFHQYIAHSGSSLCFWAFHARSGYVKHAIDLGKYFNCPTDNSKVLIDCLRGIEFHRIIDSDDIFQGILRLVHTWLPTDEPDLEGAFLTTSPIQRIFNNKMKDLPSISGDTTDEGLVVSAQLYVNDTLYNTLSNDISQFLFYITESFIGAEDAENLAHSVAKFYFDGIDRNNKPKFIQAVTDVCTDTSFLFPLIVQLQLQLQRTKSPTYFYSFDYRGEVSKTIDILGTNDNVGVTHTDDLIYLFPKSFAGYGFPVKKMTPNDQHISNVLVDLWTSFAYNGVPTSNHLPNPNIWKPYDKDSTYLKIGHNKEPSVNLYQHFQEPRMRFWIMRLLQMMIHTG